MVNTYKYFIFKKTSETGMPHPGSLPGWCKDFKPSVVHTLQSARQRAFAAEIPPSDPWLTGISQCPMCKPLVCKSFIFEKCWLLWLWRRGTHQVLYSHPAHEEAPEWGLSGPIQNMQHKNFVVCEAVFCLGWDDTLRGAAGGLSWTLQVLHELKGVLLERSGRIYCLNFAVVQRWLSIV